MYVWKIFKSNQIILQKISHIFLLTTKLFTGWKSLIVVTAQVNQPMNSLHVCSKLLGDAILRGSLTSFNITAAVCCDIVYFLIARGNSTLKAKVWNVLNFALLNVSPGSFFNLVFTRNHMVQLFPRFSNANCQFPYRLLHLIGLVER
jgi:hypothetical protein